MCAVVAMFGLTAAKCTPEEIVAVEQAYRAQVEAENAAPSGPTWSVEADCDSAHVVLTGWSGVTDIWASTGKPFAIVSLGGAAPYPLSFDENGDAEGTFTAESGTRGTPGWGWAVWINGADGPLLNVSGPADC